MKPARRPWDLFDVEERLGVLSRERLVLVPAQIAIVFDGRSWSLRPAPPQWWLDDQEELHEANARPWGDLSAVPDLDRLCHQTQTAGVASETPRTTPCRPGRGPCRRSHEHASGRRMPAA